MKKNIVILLVISLTFLGVFALPTYSSYITLKNNSKAVLYVQVYNPVDEGPQYFFNDLQPGDTAQVNLAFSENPRTLTIAVKRILKNLFWDVRWNNDVSSVNDQNVLSVTYKLSYYHNRPSFIEIDKNSGTGRLEFIYVGFKPMEITINEKVQLVLPSQEEPK